MEYKPNSLFAFFKTDNSFHGVDPITDEHVERDLLLYDIQATRGPNTKAASKEQRSADSFSLKMLTKLFRNKDT